MYVFFFEFPAVNGYINTRRRWSGLRRDKNNALQSFRFDSGTELNTQYLEKEISDHCRAKCTNTLVSVYCDLLTKRMLS